MYTQNKEEKKKKKEKQPTSITIVLYQANTDQFDLIFLTVLGITEWTEEIKTA